MGKDGGQKKMRFSKPMDGYDAYPTTSRYGWRKDPISGKLRWHGGEDKAGCNKKPVKASKRGVARIVSTKFGEVHLDHKEGGEYIASVYAHMERIPIRQGDVVEKGWKIGNVDNKGRTTGPHLHFGLVDMLTGKTLDPNKHWKKTIMKKATFKLVKKGKDLWMTKVTGNNYGPNKIVVTRGGRVTKFNFYNHNDKKLIWGMDPLVYRVCVDKFCKTLDNRPPKSDPCKKTKAQLEKCKESRQGLSKTNEKLSDDLKDLKKEVKDWETKFSANVQAEVTKTTKKLSDKLKAYRKFQKNLVEILKLPEKKQDRKEIKGAVQILKDKEDTMIPTLALKFLIWLKQLFGSKDSG